MKIAGVLIDLDGVIYTGDTLVPGAEDAVRYLKNKGYKTRFLSNSTQRSRKKILDRLCGMGLEIDIREIFTPAVAATEFIRASGKENVYFLTTDDLRSEFFTGGIPHQDHDVDWVVVGDAAEQFCYERMNQAFRLIRNGAGIIALEKDRYWMGKTGLMLSAGPFVSALEYATGKTAVLMGKPSPDYFGMALREMGLSPGETAMIGDDVATDTGGAITAGLLGILVKTGKYSDQALEHANPKPSRVLDSVAGISSIL